MDTPIFKQAVLVLLLAAASYTVAHGGRLLMRRERWPVWAAGLAFGFLAFLTSRVALAAAAWAVDKVLFGRSPDPWALVALVGLSSTPLLLSFVNLTPFYGPGVMRILYFIALIRLTSLASLELERDWLGCLGWWVAAWLLTSGLAFLLTRVFKDAKWLAWTGILGPFRTTPEAIMAKMPGLKDARWT